MTEKTASFDRQTVLVTGANGFIGRVLCRELVRTGYTVHTAQRSFQSAEILPKCIKQFTIGEFGPAIDWDTPLEGVNTIIHLVSGLAPDTLSIASELDRFRIVNVEGTRCLAEAAIRNGVRQFIFVSTIKVLGEQIDDYLTLTEDSPPRPQNAYAQSKLEAEQTLQELCRSNDLSFTILRPPLVYGPFGKGNLTALLQAVDRGWPMPLASIRNRRSLIYVENLVSAILTCMVSPQANGNIYLVSDGTDVSTPDLIKATAKALGVHTRLFAFPAALLNFGARLIGKQEIARRLTGSLCVDCSKIRNHLHWEPPYTLAQGLSDTAQWYHSQFDEKSGT